MSPIAAWLLDLAANAFGLDNMLVWAVHPVVQSISSHTGYL